jgi:F0F1-type ATP synthase membrane subunit a
MMPGHTLLKVIAGFGFEMLNFSGLELYLVACVCMVLVMLCGLELAVALIQTYVYITLATMYYVDSLYLH